MIYNVKLVVIRRPLYLSFEHKIIAIFTTIEEQQRYNREIVCIFAKLESEKDTL